MRHALAQDVRYAFRVMRRAPGFTAVAVLTLALGIGVNATVFTVTNAVLFKGFRQVERNDRILYIGTQNNGRGCCVSYPDFVDWRTQATSFHDLAAAADLQVVVSDAGGGAEHYDASQVTSNAFQVLGQKPVLGRDFAASDAQPGAAPVAILRYSFWQRRYGGDPEMVGRAIRINGILTTVIGVMPRDFAFPQNLDLWLPLVPNPALDRREARGLWFAFGRMADGVTRDSARAELETIGGRLAAAYPRTNQGWVPQPRTFAEFFVGPDAALIYGTIWGAVGLVLLIACANLANLMLARAISRSREISVRVALGAGRWRILRQLLVESLTLAALGSAAGWWIAKAGVRLYELTANPPARAWSDHLLDYSMDGHVLIYLMLVTLVTAVLFGMAPAAYLLTIDVSGTLKDGGRGVAGESRGMPWSGLVVVGQTALAVVLLGSAGVMVRSFLSMSTADLGVRTADVTAMMINLPEERYRGTTERIAFFDQLKTRLSATTGVESVAIANELPAAAIRRVPYEVAGDPAVDLARRRTVSALTIGPAYFTTLGATVVAGRDFNDFDGPTGRQVAIVNQQFASAHWPGDDPLGKRLRIGDDTTADGWLTVVGVASNIVQNAADRQVRDPLVYRPFRQQTERTMWVVLKAAGSAASAIPAVRREIQAIDADLPIWIGPLALTDLMAAMGNYWRLGNNAALFVVFAAVALLLASLGLYAVVAHAVNRRTQEIGIRIAIGATAADIVALVLGQGMRPLGIGLVIGLAASAAVMPVLKSQLVHVSPVDPISLAAAAAMLILAAMLGCLIPVRHAMRLDPVVALRHD